MQMYRDNGAGFGGNAFFQVHDIHGKGTVVAVSDPPDELEERLASENLPTGQDFVGTQVDQDLLKKALKQFPQIIFRVPSFSLRQYD